MTPCYVFSPASGCCTPRNSLGAVQLQRRPLLRVAASADAAAAPSPSPIPTRLNTSPHERSTRQHFYHDVTAAVDKAIAAGETRIIARCGGGGGGGHVFCELLPCASLPPTLPTTHLLLALPGQ